jgi:hypothetical protein
MIKVTLYGFSVTQFRLSRTRYYKFPSAGGLLKKDDAPSLR